MTDRTHDQGRVITEWYTVRMFWRAVGPCTRTVPVRAVFFCGRVIFHSAAKAETIDRRCGRAIAAPIRIAPSSGAGGPVRPRQMRARARAPRGAPGRLVRFALLCVDSTVLFSRALWRSNVDRK